MNDFRHNRSIVPPAIFAAVIFALSGCNTFERLSEAGGDPSLSKIEDPQARPNYMPVSMPMPSPQPSQRNPNSLWRNGARAFFKDQRAAQVGDLLTIVIQINDNAKLKGSTEATRGDPKGGDKTNSQSMPMPALPAYLANPLTSIAGAAALGGINVSGASHHIGDGSIDRSEAITIKLAASVAQVLPNGNFVISGRQEVRVNNELRELTIEGILRPEDIDSTNMTTYDKIAEARISYGGRGIIGDLQRPRYGQDLLDRILPF